MAACEPRKPGNVTAAARTHGQWLREQRRARGWNVQQMMRELREAAAHAGDKLPGKKSLTIMIRRWERDGSGISERYRLHYCAAFKTPADRFGDPSMLDMPHASGMSRSGTGQAGAARPRSARDQMKAALNQADDPAERDQMCFTLGYLCALMTTTTPAPCHYAVLGDTTEASRRTQGSR